MGFNAAPSRSNSNRNAIVEQLPEERVETTTHEGGVGFAYDQCEALYQLVVSSFLSGDTAYEKGSERLERLHTLLKGVAIEKPEFIPALAVYARHELNLRTTPTVLVAEALQRGIVGADRAARLVWLRGDEHLEALAYVHACGQKRTKRLMRAVQERINRLTQRQALRYACEGDGKSFSQKGAVILAHAEPSDDRQSALMAYIVKGWTGLTEEQKALLPVVAAAKSGEADASWEQLISREGSTAKTWEKAIPTMGYMALLRNLRNFVEKGISMEAAIVVAARLADPVEVARSQQLPFRFLSAYKALEPRGFASQYGMYTADPSLPSGQAVVMAQAVEKAMDAAAANVPAMPGKTLILVDVSGSMQTPLSTKSTILYSEAAAVLGAIVAKRVNGGELWAFGTSSAPVPVGATESLLSVARRVPQLGSTLGHGTEIEAAMHKALFRNDNVRFDRLMIFTDMQTWSTGVDRGYMSPYFQSGNGRAGTSQILANYRKMVPGFKAYGINMAGYSKSAFKKLGNGALTAELGGWSEKIIALALQMEANDPVGHILKLWTDSVPAGVSVNQDESSEEEDAT